MFHLSPAVIAMIDAARGDLSRSQWLTRTIEAMGRMPGWHDE